MIFYTCPVTPISLLFSRQEEADANERGLKLNDTHQLLLNADDVNMLAVSVYAINKTEKDR